MRVVYDVEDGKIQRGRLYYDGTTLALQLGLIPDELYVVVQ